jgi:DNA modification methylase
MDTTLEPSSYFTKTSDLTPWEKNPRKNDHAVDEVAGSIERFGFSSPIIANQDLRIIAGHTRWKAAQKLGLEYVPVRVLDLNDADCQLLAIADNKLGELADWDDGVLTDVLNRLQEEGKDLTGIGFDEEELSTLLERIDDTEEVDPELPEPQPVIVDVSGEIRQGDCIELMRQMDPCSIDAIVTDPPYGIGFMGKGWDCSVPGLEWARECFRVLKPGGHIVAFGGTRTIHKLTTALEDAHFEIRDQIAWMQFQGFPKSLNISKQIDDMAGAVREVVGIAKGAASTNTNSLGVFAPEYDATKPKTPDAIKWDGYGTGLKPSYEPAILARKPIEAGTITKQVLSTGTGALNIDGCRFAYGDKCWVGPNHDHSDQWDNPTIGSLQAFSHAQGKGRDLDAKNDISEYKPDLGRWPANIYQCPKPSRDERERGCEGLEAVTGAEAVERKEGSAGKDNPRAGAGRTAATVKNSHPTVKPLGVMKWLCKLVGGQPGSLILDTFSGSGTTGCAAVLQGFNFIGLEMDPRYVEISRARLAYWSGGGEDSEVDDGKGWKTE